MHHIQRKILSRLIYAEKLHYAQMRPVGVESNHFAYHLEQLMRECLVIKQEREYSLSEKGLAFADRLSHKSMTTRLQPNIVTMLYITNDVGQTLLYQFAFQPYIKRYGPPLGRLHYEENVATAASRELSEKTGFTDIPLVHRGIVYINVTRTGKDISRIMAHVFSGQVAGMPTLSDPTAKGGPVWKHGERLTKAQCMPGFKEVRKLLLQTPTDRLFFAEITAELA